MKKVCLILAVFFLFCIVGCAPENTDPKKYPELPVYPEDTRNLSEQQYTVFNTVAVDDFGRETYAVDGVKTDTDRSVGMFYFMTLGSANNMSGIYNVTEIIEKYGIEEFGKDSPNSPANKAHIWGEPVFGYYDSRDPWVIRRHVEMLTFAGIDYLCVDGTNGLYYFYVADTLLDILLEYQQKGWDVPKFSYYLGGTDVEEFDINGLKQVYERYYKDGKYDSVMYKVDGKPFVVIREGTEKTLKSSADPYLRELGNYFSFKHRQWPIGDDFHENALPWIDFSYPQSVHNDTVSVSIAQHVTVRFSDTEGTRGRGWNYKTGKNEHENFKQNINYENQWETALTNSQVKNVFLTGWNEWTATKQALNPDDYPEHNGYVMCDQFNDEFSRDIEPTKTSGMKDTAYLQTIRNLRDFKYLPAQNYAIPLTTINFNDFTEEQWVNAAVFRDFTGDAIPREFQRMDGNAMYEDYSNRNDIDRISVARDYENLYFRIQTVDPITPYAKGDQRWMNIRINTSNTTCKDAMGYEYLINSEILNDGKAKILRYGADGKYTSIGESEYVVSENVMLVKISLETLGLDAANCRINFKVTDNVKTTDILEYYVSGDSAPIGTLSYQFGY